MRPVSVGSRRRQTFSPSPDDTAGAIGNLGIDAVATITLIRYIETVSYKLVRPYYEDGEATVGTRVDVEHVAPAFPGRPIDVTCTLVEVRGRRLGFEVDVEQDGKQVMRGRYGRAVVALDRFGGQPADD